MKPHEIFELIAKLTCNEFGVTWREALHLYSKSRKRQRARWVFTALVENFLNADYAVDLLGVHRDTVNKNIFEARRTKEFKELKDLIYIYLKMQERTIKSLAV